MIQALSLKELKEKVHSRYPYDEQRIVGIMLARYGIQATQEIIEQNYLYWHINTKKFLDIYWAGYGEYLPSSSESATKTVLKFAGNDSRVYFDLDAFISIKEQFRECFPFTYEDKLQLILINYRNGKLHFDEAIRIDLEENIDNNYSSIRRILEYITLECRSAYDVKTIAMKIKSNRLLEKIKGITISDMLSTAIGIVGLAL